MHESTQHSSDIHRKLRPDDVRRLYKEVQPFARDAFPSVLGAKE